MTEEGRQDDAFENDDDILDDEYVLDFGDEDEDEIAPAEPSVAFASGSTLAADASESLFDSSEDSDDDVSDDDGRSVASGVYFLRLRAGGTSVSDKVTLLR